MNRGTNKVGRTMRRGAYLLPSLFTIGNILLGFFALVSGLSGDFQRAASLIFIAALLDGLDGRIARLTSTESEFGREFDSLADAVTFGVAPALLSYLWGLQDLGRSGWLIPLFYLVCASTRLARFNVQSPSSDGRDFVGLPTPAAAGTIAALLFFAPEQRWESAAEVLFMAALLLTGSLMVSTFRYWSPKRIDLRRRWSYRMALPLAALLLLVAFHPPAFFLSATLLYTASAPVLWLGRKLKLRWHRPSDQTSPGRIDR